VIVDPITTGLVLEAMTPAMLAALRRPAPVFDPNAFAYLRDRIFNEMRDHMFHGYRPGGAPPCRRVVLDEELGPEARAELVIHILDGRAFRLPLTGEVDPRVLMHVAFTRICELYWDNQAQAYNRDPYPPFDWRNHVELRNRLNDAERGLAPAPTVAEGFAMLGVDHGERDSTTLTVRQYLGFQIIDLVETPQRNQTRCRDNCGCPVCRADGLRPDSRRAFEDERRDAEARGIKLLKEWLSPAQLREYTAYLYFDVSGGASGKRYRIKHGEVQNVFELDSQGREICGWCFAPDGYLVPGDVMLAQKVALETNERGALKVANRFRGRDQRYDPRVGWVDEIMAFADGILGIAPRAVFRGGEAPRPARVVVTSNPVVVDSRSWTGLA
jgi:hypothetical protein